MRKASVERWGRRGCGIHPLLQRSFSILSVPEPWLPGLHLLSREHTGQMHSGQGKHLRWPQKGRGRGGLRLGVLTPRSVLWSLSSMAPGIMSGRTPPPTSMALGPQLHPAASRLLSHTQQGCLSPYIPPLSCFSYSNSLTQPGTHGGGLSISPTSVENSEAQSSKPPIKEDSDTEGVSGIQALAQQIHSCHSHRHEDRLTKWLPRSRRNAQAPATK